jgi:peroxiredoxin
MTKSIYSLICALILISICSEVSRGDDPEGLSVGEKAPLFHGIDQFNNEFNLEQQLREGPVVLIFYRGHWCKYCNQHLESLNDSIEFIIEKGASVITVTPEKMEFIDETSKKFQGSFRIISDEGMKIMEAYQVKYGLDSFTNSKYKIWGINLDKFNGENGDNLPVPATYIIDQDGSIKYTFYNTDYKKRVPIKTILENL